jgi:hypothetical protein
MSKTFANEEAPSAVPASRSPPSLSPSTGCSTGVIQRRPQGPARPPSRLTGSDLSERRFLHAAGGSRCLETIRGGRFAVLNLLSGWDAHDHQEQ